MEERISSAEAAKLIGIKTQTLAKWRWQGRGPHGWVQVSPTHVTGTFRVRAVACGASERLRT